MTDVKLVYAARDGDKTALEQIIEEHIPVAQSIAAHFFLSEDETEDLVQEGLLILCKVIGKYSVDFGANFSTFAYACMRHAMIDAVRKRRGAKYSALNNFVPIFELYKEASPDNVEDEVIRRENRKEFLLKISGKLSSLEFKAIVMSLDGLSVSDISAALGKSPKSVSNALARANIKLEKLYRKED